MARLSYNSRNLSISFTGSLKGSLTTPPSLLAPDGTTLPVTLVPGKKGAQSIVPMKLTGGTGTFTLVIPATGPVAFQNSTHVSADMHGNPDDAGFVQIMQGMGKDPDRAQELMENDQTDWETFRPEILGTMSIQHDEGAWTMAIYFTSEAAAREGEQKEPPAEVQEMMAELNNLMIGEPTFADLKTPWLYSPA